MRKKFNVKLLAVMLLLVILIFLILLAYFKVKNQGKVLNNMYLENIDISSMEYSQVKSYLEQVEIDDTNISIIYDGETLVRIGPQDIGYKLDSAKTVNNIMKHCSNPNVVINFINTIKSYFKLHNINIEYTYSEKELDGVIAKVLAELPNRVVDDSYFVEENILTLTKGNSGDSINKETFMQDILEVITKVVLGSGEAEYNISLQNAEPRPLSVDEVYNFVKKDAKDATMQEINGKPVYTTHEYGVAVDRKTLETAIASLSETNDSIKIPLEIISPSVKIGDLKADVYSDILGTCTTTFSVGNENRNDNIELATSFLDEIIIAPGEIFSFNKTVGNCGLESRGFKEATIYANGGIAQGIGGGICQVSSTLYVAALYANLEIVERYNHAYTVSYLDPSFDATISYPYLDLKFKNTREYPIKIVVAFNPAGKLTISIYGTRQEVEYEVELESETTSISEYKTIYSDDNNLSVGQQMVKQNGQNGCSSICYKILSLNGQTISKTLMSRDRYVALNKVVSVGIKSENNEE